MTNGNKGLVSVLIPSYNHDKYIKYTITSIITQLYKNIELLVLDDGSQDNSWNEIKKLQKKCELRFKNVLFQKQENKGRCTTFNTLLSQAKGEYVFIVASDDIVLPNAIIELESFLTANRDFIMSVGDNLLIDEFGNRVYWGPLQQIVYSEKDSSYKTFAHYLQEYRPDIPFKSDRFGSYESLLKGNYIPNGQLIKRQALLDTGGYTEKAPLEDYWINMQLAKLGKIKFIPKELFAYRWHEDNTASDLKYMHYITLKTLRYEIEQFPDTFPDLKKVALLELIKNCNQL